MTVSDSRVGHSGIGLADATEAFAPPISNDEAVIRPATSRVSLRTVAKIWPVIRVIGVRDLKVKYKQSLLGPIWLIIQPIGLLIAFVVAFGAATDLAPTGVSYPLFVLSALAPWTYFQAVLNMGSVSLISSEFLVRKTPAPRLAFPIGALIANLPVLLITVAATLVWSAAAGEISVRALLLPVGFAWLMLLGLGCTLALAAFAVRFRDVVSALPFVVQIGVFVTPIGYALSSLNGLAHLAVLLNPMSGVIEFWRWISVSGSGLDMEAVLVGVVGTALIALIGWRTFVRLEVRMADVI